MKHGSTFGAFVSVSARAKVVDDAGNNSKKAKIKANCHAAAWLLDRFTVVTAMRTRDRLACQCSLLGFGVPLLFLLVGCVESVLKLFTERLDAEADVKTFSGVLAAAGMSESFRPSSAVDLAIGNLLCDLRVKKIIVHGECEQQS